MALIKGKQIESIPANKIIENEQKKFISQSDLNKIKEMSENNINLSNYYTKTQTYSKNEVTTLIEESKQTLVNSQTTLTDIMASPEEPHIETITQHNMLPVNVLRVQTNESGTSLFQAAIGATYDVEYLEENTVNVYIYKNGSYIINSFEIK